jgi:hypothetical protein
MWEEVQERDTRDKKLMELCQSTRGTRVTDAKGGVQQRVQRGMVQVRGQAEEKNQKCWTVRLEAGKSKPGEQRHG